MTATNATADKWHWLHRGNKFLAKRLSTDSYVGLHLTVSFLVAAAAIWAGSALLEAVLDNRTLVHYDIALAAWIHKRVNPTGIAVSRIISEVGSPTTMGVIAVIGGGVILWRRRFTMLIAWIAAFGGGGPAASRALRSSTASSMVSFAGSLPFGSEALVVPSVTYGP